VPSESDLRDLLQGPDPEGRAAIDLDAVLSRARRRRRPKVVAAQALGSVALVGVLGTAVVVSLPRPGGDAASIAQDTSAGGEAAPLNGDTALRKEADVCGEPLVEHPATQGVTLEMTLPTTVEPDPRAIPVVVTVRNDGPGQLLAMSAGSPQVTFARDNVVLWHTPTESDADATLRQLDLAPGESADYPATLSTTVCGSEADLAPGRPADLGLAGPGRYEARAVLTVEFTDGRVVTIASEPVPVEIVR